MSQLQILVSKHNNFWASKKAVVYLEILVLSHATWMQYFNMLHLLALINNKVVLLYNLMCPITLTSPTYNLQEHKKINFPF